MGLVSVAFYLVSIACYFVVAVPTYFDAPDLQKTNTERGAALTNELESRMG